MKVLVVVDMQNDFITGSLGTPEARAIVPNVKKKVEEYYKAGDKIIFTKDSHHSDYLETMEGEKLPVEHCIISKHGWLICDDLQKYITCGDIIEKPTFASFGLVERLKDYSENIAIDEIELVGLCTDICVVSNALLLKAAFYEDCEISVDATCCAGVTPQSHEAALKTMEMCQINVKRG